MVTFTRPAANLQQRACVCTSPPPFIRNTPNKGCQSRPGAATSQGEPVSPEGTLEGNKDYLPPSSHSHHPAPRKLRLRKMQDSGPDSGGAYQRKDYREPRPYHLPKEKCYIPGDIWFSVIYSNLLFPLPALCCKTPTDPNSSLGLLKAIFSVT